MKSAAQQPTIPASDAPATNPVPASNGPEPYAAGLLAVSGSHGAVISANTTRTLGGNITVAEGVAVVRGMGTEWTLPATDQTVASQFGPVFSIDVPGQGVRFFSTSPAKLRAALRAHGFMLQSGAGTKSGVVGIGLIVLLVFFLSMILRIL